MASNGEQQHTPTPWRIHPFRTSLSPSDDMLAIRCVGKNMTGRDWTSYVENTEGVTVFQTDGETAEEAIANAQIVLRAVNAHDEMVQQLTFAVANGSKWDLNDWQNWITNHAQPALALAEKES